MRTDQHMKWSGRRAAIRGTLYRHWSKFIHRRGYHHTRTLYPADEKGVTPILKCEWCGLSGRKPKSVEEMVAEMKRRVQ